VRLERWIIRRRIPAARFILVGLYSARRCGEPSGCRPWRTHASALPGSAGPLLTWCSRSTAISYGRPCWRQLHHLVDVGIAVFLDRMCLHERIEADDIDLAPGDGAGQFIRQGTPNRLATLVEHHQLATSNARLGQVKLALQFCLSTPWRRQAARSLRRSSSRSSSRQTISTRQRMNTCSPVSWPTRRQRKQLRHAQRGFPGAAFCDHRGDKAPAEGVAEQPAARRDRSHCRQPHPIRRSPGPERDAPV
jgi:hypothetical protein